MADSDPISGSSTPNKRRKLDHGNGKAWDSQDDSGEDFAVEDFHTVATVPVGNQSKLQYTPTQLHSDLWTKDTIVNHTFITQPTQTLRLSSPPPPHNSNVLVERSSPVASFSPKPPPHPIRKAFAKPTGGLLAGAIAPPGTSFRAPAGIQSKPASVPINDSESEERDPSVHHSSDEEQTQGRSNLKPTNFKKGGRHLDSTPNRVVKESPRPEPTDPFKARLSEFSYSSSPSRRPADDTISAYASRRSKPIQTAPARTQPTQNAVVYKSLDDVDDFKLRKKVMQILEVFPNESVQRCMDALLRRRGNVDDAMEWLTADEDDKSYVKDDVIVIGDDDDAATLHTSLSRPSRPPAKQQISARDRTIAERYVSAQSARRKSQTEPEGHLNDEQLVKPKRRLMNRRPRSRSSPSSPPKQQPQPKLRSKQKIPEEDSDSDLAAEPVGVDVDVDVEPTEGSIDQRLLKFFNECSTLDLIDLSGQTEDVAKFVVGNRPFANLDRICSLSNVKETQSGKKSKSRPIGDKVVEICREMWIGYEAVDDLVEACERIAKPIQDTLKGWGVNSGNDGELQLMHLDDAHDSGIGTPTSSCPSDDIPRPRKVNPRGGFLGQPKSTISEGVTLKDYQLVGLNWLNLLWSREMSCILADEMGLGKTCQVIAFLAHLQEMRVDGVHLVIVPGSTLENWLREFKKFAPKLNVVPYYGSQPERVELQHYIESEFDSIDVVVTTIDMAVNTDDDNRFLRQTVDPLVCVLDEAHALRNRHSKRYKQLSRIPANFRVLLTGTPLQNNLQELMAILAFITPDLFKEKEEDLRFIFQHKATTKDVQHAALLSAQRINRARSMMTPFILRRKKDQVLDLPPKHNRVEYCDMTVGQSSYYTDLRQNFLDYLESKLKKSSKVASSNMLMALRKAAIHPLLARRLYDDKKIDKITVELLKHPEFADNTYEKVRSYLIGEHHQSFKGGDYGLHVFCHQRDYLRKFELKKSQWMDAGKIAKFTELMRQFAANDRGGPDRDRVLVFSQFTTMMDILEAVLETLQIKFMRLDGSTDMQVRQDMIDKFSADPDITVFMLSTKAGGAGINLACANKVIVFDSSFNPQDDIQAENRAHRVGQTREVEVIRLVTRNTIEEQIEALGESKLKLGERVAEGGTAAEEKQADKAGEKIVTEMFLDSLKREDENPEEVVNAVEEEDIVQEDASKGVDLKDAFRSRLENAGVRVSSKQAQF